MKTRFIFITGMGRSGTSTVARVLHQNNVVCVGHSFDEPNKFNPQGYWEDAHIKNASYAAIVDSPQWFLGYIKNLHAIHDCYHPILGYKHPKLVELPKETWEELNPEIVINCTRPRWQIIDSLLRRNGGNLGKAERFYNRRFNALESNLLGLPFVHPIDFSEYRTDEWVLQEVLALL